MNLRNFFAHSNWWGKILGAFFGYLIGGPAGALFGIIIGNFFDQALRDHLHLPPYWHYHKKAQERAQQVFFQSTFAIMGYVAKADGRISEEEISIAKTLMIEMRLSTKQKNLAKHYFREGKAISFNLIEMLNEFEANCYNEPDLLKLFMDMQYRAAIAGGLSEAKIQVLDRIFKRLGFAPLRQQYRFYQDFSFESQTSHRSSSQRKEQPTYHPPPNNLTQAYALLEISIDASKQDVKRAYRRLVSKNHPDKLIAQGMSEQSIKIANDKTQRIRKAYEQICASKGW